MLARMATIVRFTRRELYDLVWSKPMTSIAQEFCMSSNALAKHIDKLEIPRPPRGYWQQLAAGIDVERDPLPKPSRVTPDEIEITKHDPRDPPPPRAEVPSVSVSMDMRKPHAVVAQLRDALRGPKGNELEAIRGEGHAVLKTSSASRKRALLLLDALFKALDERGHTVKFGKRPHGGEKYMLTVTVAGKPAVELWLIERLEQSEHQLTNEETQQKKRKYGWTWASKYDYAYSERLVLEIDTPWDSRVRKRWADRKTQRLEDVLGEVVVGIEVAAEAWREDRERRAREEAERQRARREAERRGRQAAHEQALGKDLVEMAERWKQATTLRHFLLVVRQRVVEPRSEGFSAWLSWADAFAETIDPLHDKAAIAKVLHPAETEHE